MAKKILNDTTFGDKVSFKDPQYGSGYVVGYNKDIGKHLIGYTNTNKRPAGAFQNKSGVFITNKEGKYVYSDKVKGYEYYFYADSVLELLNTEEGKDGLTVGDEVEVYCNSAGTPITKTQVWDNSAMRQATVVGFDEAGNPVLYFNAPPAGFAEYGNRHSVEWDRVTDGQYADSLDKTRMAFLNGSNINMSKINNKTRKETKVKTMSNAGKDSGEKSFFEMMKSDAGSAAYRVASKQMTVGTKKAILSLMEKKGQSSDRIQALSEMLDTDIGEAIVAMALGMGLTYIPVVSQDPRAAKLADEFRVSGMATAGNAVFEIALENFMPVIQSALANLPGETAEVRVSTDTKARISEPVPAEETPVEKVVEKTLTA